MTVRNTIRFFLNAEVVKLSTVKSGDTLLDFLRLKSRLTGTKEGCAEGDCGACTVLVGHLQNGALHYLPVNACIRFIASLDGCHVVTVEHLSPRGGPLHPVQKAMVDHHGSQCGFCTPGIVMALYALWMQTPQPDENQVKTALQGNLCRCTGYAPIIRAALCVSEYGSPAADALLREREAITKRLKAWEDHLRVEIKTDQDHIVLPGDVADLAQALAAYPEATIIAGATDVGLWVTKFLRPITPVVHIGHLRALQQIIIEPDHIKIGAGVSYSQLQTILQQELPHLTGFWSRIAGWQVRNMGTIGGNIANGSPIGDMPPVMIALGASVTLRHKNNRRSLPLETFFIDYGQQDLRPGEFIESITLPRRNEGGDTCGAPAPLNSGYKISKRRDDDISSVSAGFHVKLDADHQIRSARIAFGGMAGTPKRATAAENALLGQPFCAEALQAAAQTLSEDFTPLSDSRASAGYRMLVAQNLFSKFFEDHSTAAGQAAHGAEVSHET